jgi:hypothetical protein
MSRARKCLKSRLSREMWKIFSRQPSAKSCIFLLVKKYFAHNSSYEDEKTLVRLRLEGISSRTRTPDAVENLQMFLGNHTRWPNVHGHPIKAFAVIVNLAVYLKRSGEDEDLV